MPESRLHEAMSQERYSADPDHDGLIDIAKAVEVAERFITEAKDGDRSFKATATAHREERDKLLRQKVALKRAIIKAMKDIDATQVTLHPDIESAMEQLIRTLKEIEES